MSVTTSALPHGRFFGRTEHRAGIDGFSMARMAADPLRDVVPHTHETAHWILVLSGPYITSARGASPLCVRPALIYNPPGTTHRDRFRAIDGRFKGQFLSVAVGADRLSHISDQVPLVENAILLHDPQALNLAMRLAFECTRWDTASPLVAEGLCLELMANAALSRQRDVGAPRWLSRARELLRDECAESLTVGDVARAVDVHPVYLARAFRRFFACGPGDYLRRCRIERSAALLVETLQPLTQVAFGCGFADQSHFSRAFRSSYGVTPGEFRSRMRGKDVSS